MRGSHEGSYEVAHALAWPERIDSGVEPLDLIQVSQLNFEAADLQRFPCIDS